MNRRKTSRSFCAEGRVLFLSAAIFLVSAVMVVSKLKMTCMSLETADPAGNAASAAAAVFPEAGSASPAETEHRIPDYPALLSNPELPTGCEVTSLASALNYLGFKISKTALADQYLPCDRTWDWSDGELTAADPAHAFVGSPYDASSYGCYAPVIAETANAYLRGRKAKLTAHDLTGIGAAGLYRQVDRNRPVIVWATIGMKEPYVSIAWRTNTDGRRFGWLCKEHCLVLIGHSAGTVTFEDPLNGITSYDRALFETRFEQMGKMAVVIY